MSPKTMKLSWVNGGEAFSMSYEDFTSEDQRRIRRAYTNAKIDTKKRLSGLSKEEREEVQGTRAIEKDGRVVKKEITLEHEVTMDSMIDAGMTITRRALIRVDPSLSRFSEEEILDKLEPDEFQKLMGMVEPPKKEVDPNSPRGQTSKTMR